jgi:hypothetical protein
MRFDMGFFDNLAKAITEVKKAQNAPVVSGKFAFQDEGKAPLRDSSNRVIVKVQTGSSISLGVNEQSETPEVVKYLLGKPEADKEIENRSVRLRIFRDLESEYPDSVKIETTKGDFIGWVLKNDSAIACKVIDSLTQQVRQVAPELDSLVFDVGAKVDGAFDEDEDEEGKTILVPNFDVVLKIKDPAEIDIQSE